MIKKILYRIYGDYLMSSRLSEYEAILRTFKEAGYESMTIRDVCLCVHSNQPLPRKLIVYRHDVDVSLKIARKMFKLEKKCNIRASYYFRLSTLDFDFMKEIENFGGEASYHYEEISSFVKKRHLKDLNRVLDLIPQIKNIFEENLKMIEANLGRKIVTVASHGDFSNRKLGITNCEILKDRFFRKKVGILCECYDDELMKHFDCYISDASFPEFYKPLSPLEAIKRYERIYFLSHPIHWEADFLASTKHNLIRLYEHVMW